MPFTIPNKADAPFILDQADLDKVDLDILVGASAMTAVMYGRGWLTTGLAVTPQSALTVSVAAGEARVRGRKVKYAGGTKLLTASGANPRFILITLSDAGVLGTANGTAAASPKFPTLPTNVICLAAVYLPTSATTIAASQITDKRMFAWDPYVENVLWYGALGDGSTNDQPACQLAYNALPDTGGAVVWPDGQYKINQDPGNPGFGILVQDKAGVKSIGLPGKAMAGNVGGASLQVGTSGMTLFKFLKQSGGTATHSGPTFQDLTFEDTKPTANPSPFNAVAAHYNAGTTKLEFTWAGHGFAVGDVIRPFNFGVNGWNDDYETNEIIAGSWASGVATITTGDRLGNAVNHGLVVNQYIVISKASGTNWNGTYQITAKTNTTLSFAKAVDPGAWVQSPSQGGIVYKAWVVDGITTKTVANDTITAYEPTNPGVDSTGQIAFEIMHNKPTAILLHISGPTRSYVHRCTFTTGKVAVKLESANSTDVSWGTIDWCTFTENDVAVKISGNGGHSYEIVGGDYALHTGQVGIKGPNPEESGAQINQNHLRVRGMKVDTRHTSGNGCWFIDSGPIQRYYEFGPFNVEMEGDCRAIRSGGDATGSGNTAGAKGGHGTIMGIGGQHNDNKSGVCIELFGGGDTLQMTADIFGGEYASWDTAILVGDYCQSVQVWGGVVTRGNKGITTTTLSEATACWGFVSTNSETGYLHIDNHGSAEKFNGCDDPDSPSSKHKGEGLGTKVFTSAPVAGDGYDGEVRLVSTGGNVYLYGKVAGAWIRIQLTTSGASGGGSSAAVPIAIFSKQGSLAVGAGTFRQYINGPWTITKVTISVGTAPVGASIRVDVNKGSANGASGTSIWNTTQANRPAISAGQFRGNQTTFDTATLADDDFLTCDIDVVGSTTAGSDLVVQVFGTPG